MAGVANYCPSVIVPLDARPTGPEKPRHAPAENGACFSSLPCSPAGLSLHSVRRNVNRNHADREHLTMPLEVCAPVAPHAVITGAGAAIFQPRGEAMS